MILGLSGQDLSLHRRLDEHIGQGTPKGAVDSVQRMTLRSPAPLYVALVGCGVARTDRA